MIGEESATVAVEAPSTALRRRRKQWKSMRENLEAGKTCHFAQRSARGASTGLGAPGAPQCRLGRGGQARAVRGRGMRAGRHLRSPMSWGRVRVWWIGRIRVGDFGRLDWDQSDGWQRLVAGKGAG
uniref:Uncharacterized protein n=1 Tax=Arundo donax TaxID=35708 RepID=A0A0A9E4F6_ARUDO